LKTADINVKLLNFMGDDLDVANVARVSFDKQTDYDAEGNVSERDTKLIGYLAEHGHWSPFAHCFAQFRIKAPIFVARQLVKHQVGLSWNEVSRRYVDSEPEFYIPTKWRGRAENVKQGSGGAVEHQAWAQFSTEDHTDNCLNQYNDLLHAGVCPEQARMVLPLNTMTEWIWSGSLMAFARVCQQRLDPHAQLECQEVAGHIATALSERFPIAFNALMD
jgi:thymidylate synthase (FAD)